MVQATRAGLLDRMGVSSGRPVHLGGQSDHDGPRCDCLHRILPDARDRSRRCGTGRSRLHPRHHLQPLFGQSGDHAAVLRGFIPVLSFPRPGPPAFEPPTSGYHIDGMHAVTVWPDKFFLVVFAYLSDTADYGGATTVRPGSHRQVFEHWLATGEPGNTTPPALAYADPLPLPGKAGRRDLHALPARPQRLGKLRDHIRVGLNTAVMPDPERPYQPQDWRPATRLDAAELDASDRHPERNAGSSGTMTANSPEHL